MVSALAGYVRSRETSEDRREAPTGAQSHPLR